MKVVLHVRALLVAPRAKEEEETGRTQEKCLISVQAVLSSVAWGLGFIWVDSLTFMWVEISEGMYGVDS